LKRSTVYTTLYDVESQNSMMMTMYCIACTLPLPTLPHLLTTAASQMSRWLSCGLCWLLSDQYRIGCHNEKNITQ